MAHPEFRWRNLTTEVADKASPPRQHLDARVPDSRPLQAEYKARAGSILVPPGGAHPGTLGAAFDFTIRYSLDPKDVASLAFLGFMFDDLQDLIGEVVDVAEAATTFGPNTPEMMRACWALALCTEVIRVGLLPGSPLADLVAEDRFTADALLALADQRTVDELLVLYRLADERLLEHIRHRTPMTLGPTFAGSRQCSADADLIAGGALIDLKCTVGKRNSAGVRYIALDRTVIYQLVAYALFDYIDKYNIEAIGLYSARYGHFIQWPLQDVLDSLAGRRTSLAEERRRVQELLTRLA